MASHNITAQNLIEFVPPLSLTGGPIASCWIVRSGPNMHSGPIIHISYDKSHALQTIRNQIYANRPRGWDNIDQFLEKGGVQLISAETNRDMGMWWRYTTAHGEEKSLWLVLQTWRMEMIVMRTPQGPSGLDFESAQGGTGIQNVLHAPPPTSMPSGASSAGGLSTQNDPQENKQQSGAVPDSSRTKNENGYASMAEEIGNIAGNTGALKPVLCGTKPPQPPAQTSQSATPPPYTGFKPSATTVTSNQAPISTHNSDPLKPFFGQTDSSQPKPTTTSQNQSTVSFTTTQQPFAPLSGSTSTAVNDSSKPANPFELQKLSPGQPAATSLTQPATWSFAPLASSASGLSAANTLRQPGTTFTFGASKPGFEAANGNSTNITGLATNPLASSGGSTPFAFGAQSTNATPFPTAGIRSVKPAKGARRPQGPFS